MGADLNSDSLVHADDAQLDALFRGSGTLGIERMVNSGERKVDLARHEIYNDAYWKGYLPQGLALGEIAAQLYTGYYKRFWCAGGRYVGETRYLDGRVPLRHTLETVALEHPVNDLAAGAYILLRYADPVFEHLFYDVMKVVSPDVVLYRGYSGRFPEGRRGWCAPLLRRYGFAQMDAGDHGLIFESAAAPEGDLSGTWRLDVIANANHAKGVCVLDVERFGAVLRSRCQIGAAFEHGPLPASVLKHFSVKDFRSLLDEIRAVDRDTLIGRWITTLRKADAGSTGLLHTARDKGGQNRLTLDYLLTRIG